MSPLNEARRNAHTIVGYRHLADRLEAELDRLTSENHRLRAIDAERLIEIDRLAAQNFDLMLALLGAVIVECPPAAFPDYPAPHIDPPPHHPDHEQRHIVIATATLDARMAS